MTKMSRLKQTLLCTALLTSSLAFSQPLDQIVVVVNDDIVTQQELNDRIEAIKDQYRDNPAVLPSDDILSQQIIDSLILESLQLQLAKRGNLVIPEQQVDTALTNIAKNQKMSLSQFLNALKNSGRDVDVFREQIRNELTISELQKQIVGRKIFVSDSEIDRFILSQSGQSLKDTEYQLGYLRFELTNQNQADNLLVQLNNGSELLAEPDSRDLGMRLLKDVPSIFRTLVPVLHEGEAILVEKNGALHLAQLVAKTKVQSVNIEEFQIRHILIKTDALFNDKSAQTLLSNLKSKIQSGTSMADLAMQYSQDTGSKGNGGDLGFNSLDNFVPEFSNAARQTKQGQVSEVFKSPFGYHILRVEKVEARDVGLDVLRNQVRNELSQRRYNESLQRWLTELRAESYVEYRR